MAVTEPARPRRGSVLARLLDPRPYIQAFRELFELLSSQRALTLELAKREVNAEHSGKRLGAVWGVIQPLFLLGVYASIYGIVFKAKIGGTYELPRDFTVYLLAGLISWLAFQFSMAKSTTLISGNAHLVKQVVFDLNVLPIASALASLVTLLLGLGFVTVYLIVVYGALPWTYLMLPVLVLLQFLAMAGAAFVLSSIGTFVQDIRDLVQLSGVVLIFLMPIVYLPSAVPAAFDPLLWLNPFSYMVWCYQDVLYYGRLDHFAAWVIFPAWSLFLFLAGYRLFRRVRPFFSDAL